MSFAIWIGKDLTSDGQAYLAGYGDEPSSHWLEVVDEVCHPPGATIEVGVTADAALPGVRISIPQVPQTFRHLRVDYSYFRGVPAPLTNGGVNDRGVGVRDVWSNSRKELVDITPVDQRGLNYSDLSRIILERATSAREGMELIGTLVEEHGYATYGGNSHLIADGDEAWVVIEFAGGHGLWCAQRFGPDQIKVSRPGFIGIVPSEETENFRHSANFFDIAEANGWWRDGQNFDVNAVYGDGKGQWEGAKWITEELGRRSQSGTKIRVSDLMWALRTPRLTGDTAGYGQIIPLGQVRHPETRMMWHAAIGAVVAPFTPVFMGVRSVPEEFRKHRYLTAGEESRFLDLRYVDRGDFGSLSTVSQGVESTRSAVAVFKRLMNLAFQRHEVYLPELAEVWEGLENRLLEEVQKVSSIVGTLLDDGEVALACDVATYYTRQEMLRALDAGERLASALEVRSRAIGALDTNALFNPQQLW